MLCSVFTDLRILPVRYITETNTLEVIKDVQ